MKICHKTFFIFLILIFSVAPLSSQHFEWASSGSNLFNGYKTGCLTSDGKLVAAGQYEELSYMPPGTGFPVFFSGSGKEYRLQEMQTQCFIVCYDASGEILWKIDGQDLSYSNILLGVTAIDNGKTVVAFRTISNIRNYKLLGSDKNLQDDNYESEQRVNPYKLVFFAIIESSGSVSDIYGVKNLENNDWNSFNTTPDGGYVISYASSFKTKDKSDKQRDVAHNFTVKLNKEFEQEWVHKVMYLDESCCTFHAEPSISTVSPNGNIYSCGNFRMGARPDGGSDFMIRNYKEKNTSDKPYESYLSSIRNDGKLNWIKYTGAGTLISSVCANNEMIIVGGKINRQKSFMGKKVDTTEQKIAFLASISPHGKILWVNTYNAVTINAVSIDKSGFIYASFNSNRSTHAVPLKIGSDTIPNTFKRVVVASFDKLGKYRWFKLSNAMMSEPSNTKLYNDECGNLMLTGEMWYSLKVNMSLFDAAIVKGEGYGGAPLAAKIRTTIPDELLSINEPLVNSEKISSNSQQTCVPIPYPWKLELFPNPTTGLFTIKATTSYADNKVSIELWDSKGKFVKRIMEPQQKEAGIFTLDYTISDMANGIYIVVLRGSRIATTERIVLNK